MTEAGLRVRCPLCTDSGAFALWDLASFEHIRNYDHWEKDFLSDQKYKGHIVSGHMVPIDIGGDGSFEFELRRGDLNSPARLNERELKYLTVSSQAYFFRAGQKGSYLSGIEFIGASPEKDFAVEATIPPGEYEVTVHLINWGAEPGMRLANGDPAKNALADFTVLVNRVAQLAHKYRTQTKTFDAPK